VRERLRQTFPEQHSFEVVERDGRVHAVMEIIRNGKLNE
jgi:hypothetical protein